MENLVEQKFLFEFNISPPLPLPIPSGLTSVGAYLKRIYYENWRIRYLKPKLLLDTIPLFSVLFIDFRLLRSCFEPKL